MYNSVFLFIYCGGYTVEVNCIVSCSQTRRLLFCATSGADTVIGSVSLGDRASGVHMYTHRRVVLVKIGAMLQDVY